MNRFTIFTIILSVSVITVFADLLVRDYVGADGLASVISNNGQNQEEVSPVLDTDADPIIEESDSTITPDESVTSDTSVDLPPNSDNGAQTQPVTPSNTATPSTPPVTFVTNTTVKSAGFAGTVEKKQFPGKLFQLLDISTFPVESIDNYMIQENSVAAASVTEIVLRDEIQALQLYLLLQNKTKPYIDLTLNETNAYGDRSFYVNHKDKPNEAFLTVKIKNRIYGFAYVKFYHPELKKLIGLLVEAK